MTFRPLLEPSLPSDLLDRVCEWISGFPNPRGLAVRLSRILATEEARNWAEKYLFEEGEPNALFTSIAATLSQSEFLTLILEREPSLLISFQSDSEFARSSGPKVFENELHRHLESLTPEDTFKIGLSRFRLHEIFRIAVRDITGRAPIEILSRELSDLADFVLRAAYDKTYAETLLSMGVPFLESGEVAEMAVISLGKHGSRELNFSSDLDLIFISEGEGKTDLDGRIEAYESWLETHPFARYLSNPIPKARMRPATFEAFFNELATRLIELISEPGPLGAIYRIDMRLRPHGASGALVQTPEGILSYYQNWGERWERQALLRARFCIGNPKVRQRFEAGTEQFIYRKYVDDTEVEETLRDMRELRFRSIDQAGSSPEERSRNIKNGPGGIRDIEFLVQAVQILYAGGFPELRVGNVFELLRRVHQSGLMGASDFEILSSGYQFLRKLEHRVQMDDLQRYHLPVEEQALESLALGLNFPDRAMLLEEFTRTTSAIHQIFRVVFRVEEGEDTVADLVDLKELTEEAHDLIAGYGLTDPQAVFRSIQRLANDPDSPHLNSKLRRLLKKILPRLLKTAKKSPHPDLAWKAFENKALCTPARATFFSIVEESPQFLILLLDLGASSPYLLDVMNKTPGLVDDLVRRADFHRPFVEGHIESLFSEEEGSSRTESGLPLIRSFRRRAEFHIAGRFVIGLSDINEATGELSSLAEFVLRKVAEETWNLGSLGLALFGMGKMGGREIGFSSDLDLIAFYDERLQKDSLLPHRLVAKLLNEMNRSSEDGKLFEADLRLRPHGKNSPLVPGIDAAIEYYREEGQTWEKLALIRLRPLYGEGVLLSEIQERIFEWVFSTPAEEQTLAEIESMRLRIQREKPKQHLKAGPGGLLDVEFIAQAGQLAWACDRRGLRDSNTCRAIEKFKEAALLEEEAADALVSSYRFQRELENRLFLLGRSGSEGPPSEESALRHLVDCINHAESERSEVNSHQWSVARLLEEYRHHQSRTREIFEELFHGGFLQTRG